MNVDLAVVELGWLMIGVWQRSVEGDPFARAIYLKLKAATIASGVEWYYGDPWEIEGEKK